MTSPLTILRLRRQRPPPGRLPRAAGLGCSLALALGLSLAALLAAAAYAQVSTNLPAIETIPHLLDAKSGILLEPTRIYDRSGKHILLTLENPAVEARRFLDLDPAAGDFLPPALISATLATTDPAFFNHPGVTLDTLLDAEPATLAQRLVDRLLLWDRPPGLQRSLERDLLAMQLTLQYGRNRVLVWYLNSAGYGRLVFGAEAAARVYFDKNTSDLTIGEAALLAGVAGAPALNPLDAPQAAPGLQRLALDRMVITGWISAEQARAANEEPLALRAAVPPRTSAAPAFAAWVLRSLETSLPRAYLERGGLTMITSLDYDLQTQTACALETQIARLRGLPDRRSTLDGAACEAGRLLPTLPGRAGAAPLDASGAAILLDPATGEVLALVGGAAPGQDPTRPPGRPAGTLLSPLIYLAGFTRGQSPASLTWDLPDPALAAELGRLAGEASGPLRLRLALANDAAGPAQQVLAQAGLETILRIAAQLGLVLQPLPAFAGLADLYSQEVTLLDAARAYAILANQGVLAGVQAPAESRADSVQPIQPVTILTVEDAVLRLDPGRERVWQAGLPAQRLVLSAQLAYLMNHSLSDEAARWPSLGHPNPLEIGRPAAAKLGRLVEGEGAWTLGYTPRRLAAIWMQAEPPQGDAPFPEGASAAVWHAVMQYASRDLPALGWETPAGVVTLPVCDPSGLLPTSDCPTVVSEIFLAGSEPLQADTLYQRVSINRETGRLATIFTAPEQVETRVYLTAPAQAQEWARQAGLAVAPEDFDLIRVQTSPTDTVRIASPALFASVDGKVQIRGSADLPGFQSYRLLVGAGPNPARWEQIGADHTRPVANGLLGEWDTAGLSGLYAIQLVVTDEEQNLRTAAVLVSVDNTPPSVAILTPEDGTVFRYPLSAPLVFSASAADDLELAGVQIYLDNRLLAELAAAPFTFAWQGRLGKHTLRLVALDRAGNTSEQIIQFEIVR